MNFLNRVSALLFLLFFLFAPLLSFGQTAQPAKKKVQSPIQIEADHMLSDQKNSSVLFSGKVEATQDDVVIHADEMTVYYSGNNSTNDSSIASNSRNIQRLLATGSVEISKGEWVATGDSAEYFEIDRKIILTGNTKVWQDNNLVTGDKFIMYLDEEKSVVESNSDKKERVRAFFYPNK